MDHSQTEDAGVFDGLPLDPSLIPDLAEELEITSLGMLQSHDRCLYLKWTTALTELGSGERRILAALARQGDTVFVAVGEQPGRIQLSYRLPDLENAVAFGAEGLSGLIQQWFNWANSVAA